MAEKHNPEAQAAEEEIILLTEVLEEPPLEPVLELGDEERDFLKGPKIPPASPEADDSLADLLAALKDLPPEFPVPEESPPDPLASPRAAPASETTVPVAPVLPMSEAQMAEMVRQAATEIVTRLAREVVPQVAERLVAEEIRALKKRLLAGD